MEEVLDDSQILDDLVKEKIANSSIPSDILNSV